MPDLDVNFDPITVNSGPVTIDIQGLDDLRIRFPDTIATETELTLRVPDPIQTDSKLRVDSASELTTTSDITTRSDVNTNVDLQPVVLDQCLRLSLGPLPPTRICLPSRQHVGFSLFGIEIVGVTLEGEARVDVSELPKRPFIRTAKKDGGLRVSLGR